MTYVPTILTVAAWFAILLFFIGRYVNDIRLVHNNIAPDKAHSDFRKPGWRAGFNFHGMDPAVLTETGRIHLKRGIQTERILVALMVGGLLLIASLF